jgi:hypothetical protein
VTWRPLALSSKATCSKICRCFLLVEGTTRSTSPSGKSLARLCHCILYACARLSSLARLMARGGLVKRYGLLLTTQNPPLAESSRIPTNSRFSGSARSFWLLCVGADPARLWACRLRYSWACRSPVLMERYKVALEILRVWQMSAMEFCLLL